MPVSASVGQSRRQQRGWCWYDWANSVFPTSVTSIFLSLYLTSVATAAAQADTERNGPRPCPAGDALRRCDISLFGVEFPAGSLWGYLLSASTVVQVVILPVVGAIADRGGRKRSLLAFLVAFGSLAAALLALAGGTNWQLGAALFLVANVCWGASVVVYYSFLPEIATADERDQVSARGWAFGFLGGGVALSLHVLIYLAHGVLGITEDMAIRLIFLSTGVWWALFTLVPLTALRGVPSDTTLATGSSAFSAGFRQLWTTVREARHIPLTLAFLGTYMVYTDGISTVTTVSAQYGSLQLRLPRESLIVTFLIVQFIAYLGGMAHGYLAGRIGAKKTIMVSLSVWCAVLTGAAFVEAGQPLQFYAVAGGIGLVLGGTNALSRSLYSQMVPAGREAQYFSLYEISERSTAWLGPLLFAAVGQVTGSFRLALISLIVFFVVGLILVALVPVRRAIEAVGNRAPNTL